MNSSVVKARDFSPKVSAGSISVQLLLLFSVVTLKFFLFFLIAK